MQKYIGYEVTGKDRSGTRFKLVYGADGYDTARMINVYNGTLWGLLPHKKRVVLKRYCN